ncbi:MAG: hypothetical protein DI533_04690 [Cereibacter sphaeroides]|uniref:Uncharacterized protein n=1 Tax=Cereibacter sphaeroides TaxID=1063 RepID=A0A2W5SGK5_CERSP|nr:MAG: hypothetical protein DI533_04690 [Cereibacter sphaeroides]
MPAPIATSTIAAQAFRFLELSPISSYGDGSEQASAAAEQYPIALASCLSAADWSDASTLARLPAAILGAQDAIDPRLPFLYRLPADCLVVREVGDACVKWRVDKIGLRADAPAPLLIRYTARVENEAILPARLQTAIAAELALLLAPRFLTTQAKVASLRSVAPAYLKDAMRRDARSASDARYDGMEDQGDWVSEAIR